MLIIILMGIALFVFPPSDLVGRLFDFSGLAWITVTFFSSDRVDKVIESRIAKQEEKRKEKGKRPLSPKTKRQLGWPRRELKSAAVFWGMATLFYGLVMVIESIPELQIPNLMIYYFFGATVWLALAVVASGNVAMVSWDEDFKRTITPPKVLGAIMVPILMIGDILSGTLALEFSTRFSLLPLVGKLFILSIGISFVGETVVFYKMASTWKKGPSLSLLGILLYSAPMIELIVFGILGRLGVPT